MTRELDDKQHIQDRMYKEAAAIYEQYTGKKLTRLEGFDPLVYMLIGACASEFGKFSQEIQSSWARMLEHLAKLLIPEVHTGAVPAHAIVHARSTFGTISTQPDTDFAQFQTYEGENIVFSPTGRFKLWSGDVQFMASSNNFFSIDSNLAKKKLLKSRPNKSIPPLVMWIGLALHEETESLDGLRFYFDWPSETLIKQSDELLESSSWILNGYKLEKSVGLFQVEDETLQNISSEFHLARKMEHRSNSFFRDSFLTLNINEPLGHFQKAFYPHELKAIFDEDEMTKEIKEPLYWFKVTFSQAFFSSTTEAIVNIDKVTCLLNCVPVLNRKLSSPSLKLDNNINLFPLKSEGYFLAVEDVISSRLKTHYQEKPFVELFNEHSTGKEVEVRTYSLRKEGVNRFDERDAIAVIENLLRYMREESFIFSALGSDIVSNNIKAINKALNDIERKISQKKKEEGITQQPSIFIAFPPSNRENVIVRYWSTNGFIANNIPSGEELKLQGGASLDKASLRLVTKTAGGRNPLGEMDRLHEFKSTLIAREKIVTQEDIRLFCYNELGDTVKQIKIQPGIKISSNRKEGLIRTLDVHIHLNDKFPAELEFQLLTSRKLEGVLNEQSSIILPIRVFLIE